MSFELKAKQLICHDIDRFESSNLNEDSTSLFVGEVAIRSKIEALRQIGLISLEEATAYDSLVSEAKNRVMKSQT